MKWLELSVTVPWEYVEPITYLFNRYGRGFSIEGPEANQALLRSYLPSTSKKRLASIDIGVKLVGLLVPTVKLIVTELKQADWENAWKAHFGLLRVGQRLVIRPSWVEHEVGRDEVMVTLDPGMAFGTGYHPTTRMCLTFLEKLVRPGIRMLDLGTGSGILTIAAVRLGAGPTLGLDIDPTAIRVARSNCRVNGLGRTARLVRGTLPHESAPAHTFDLVVANISARVIQEKACHVWEAMRPQGTLVASGIIRRQAGEVVRALEEAAFVNISLNYLDDWTAIVATKAQ